mmetsp:Transcript_27740/g.77726  ORF Transcript_27740/g.77726 Transcript_27740/m.77726 type:complete len:788 (+) Transcript_27740:417-2780(+)|eukprot:CAMPEP_0119562682 /NCGR_PEP_ID=MMETSP1352-20130426/21209_1 /TAXON_ID=265584 /ORGANISM="Stauroneis constricta, Strain CCMP1120" /LENGTH=787 /DNA_ID=CAMNT_0007611131 /DNA_START=254 /DNA_END=2617 /DNA_ORIENTATION=-
MQHSAIIRCCLLAASLLMLIASAGAQASPSWKHSAIEGLAEDGKLSLSLSNNDRDEEIMLRRRVENQLEPMPLIEDGHLIVGKEGVEEETGGEGHHGEEEEEEEEEELDEEMVMTTTTAIVLMLIIMTIAFEKAKHHIEHTVDRNLKPITESMFGELTVLGFLSIFTFCVTKMGFFTILSEKLFGEEEALLEEFEYVHYFLFFIMVFFVTLVMILVQEAKALETAWFGMDRACLDRPYIEKLQSEWTALCASDGGSRRRRGTTILSHLGDALVPFYFSKTSKRIKGIEDQLLFERVRREFILERSPKEPFEPAPEEHRVPGDFHFGRYLSIWLGKTLAHSIHVGEITWGVFALLTLAIYGVLEIIDDRVYTFAWVWAGLGWLMFLLSTMFDFHLLQILGAHAARSSASHSSGQGEEVPLMPSSSAQLPAWCSIDLDSYMAKKRSWITKCLHGRTKQVPVRRQDTLYILEHSGPKLYGIIFQIKLVFVAAYWSLLVLAFLPYAWHEEGPVEFTIYAIVSILPSFLLRVKGKHSASLLAKVGCIGVHSKPQIIAQVIREEKTARVVRAFCILQKLQQAAEHGFEADGDEHNGNGHAAHHNAPAFVEARHWDPLEVAQVTKTFHAFDASKDGNIATSELTNVMQRLGIHMTEESLSRMVNVLDTDKNGVISEEEFVRFYMKHISVGHNSPDDHHEHDAEHGGHHHRHHILHERAEFFFKLFDADGSGSISIGEFKTTLDAFEVGFTVDEVGELISELDSHADGTLSLHEFVQLFEQHDKLVAMERSSRLL